MTSRPLAAASLLAATSVLLLSSCRTMPSTTPASATPSTSPTVAASTSVASASSAAPQSPRQSTAGCGEGPIVPASYSITGLGRSGAMPSLGQTSDGNVAAPAQGHNYELGWYKLGPKPGSGKGHVVLTVHTSLRGPALGQEMRDKLQPGDIIRVADKAGTTVCFRYSGKQKIWVKDYKNSDTTWINDDGPARLAILTCDDYNRSADTFESRWIMYADQVPATR